MTDEHVSLQLIGWYGTVGHGFSVPLFGQSERANSLYTARCSVSGDHQGTIAGFDAVDVHECDWLPAGEAVPLAVGDPWHDVFVWNGIGYVGTPDVLWAELEPFHGDLEEMVPLSFLDLALYADRDEVLRLAPLAFAYFDERFERAVAQRWRRQFLRQWLETETRRKLAGHYHDEEAFRSVAVRESGANALIAIPPDSLLRTLIETGAIGQLSERLAGLAVALGADITLPDASNVDATAEAAAASDSPPAALPTEPVGFSTVVSVIAVGKRSRDIVRHVRRSRKAPTPVARSAQDDDWLIVSSARGQDGILDRPGLWASTIMLLLDEDDPEGAGSRRLAGYLHRQADAGALVILVPALPIRHPSRILDGGGRLPELAEQCHAILDSAIARSPFWWGRSKRSFDRRIADVITVATAACRSRGLREELRARRAGGVQSILAVGLVPRGSGSRQYDGGSHAIWLGSEATWVSSNPKRGGSAILFSLRINPDDVGLEGVEGQVMAEGRRNVQRFAEFAGAVVAHVLGGRHRGSGTSSLRIREEPSIPDTIAKRLAFPRHSRAFRVEGNVADFINLVVVGETPTVNAVAAAGRVGWRIARYTDSTTIRRIAEESGGDDILPDEIEMGTVRSSEINRQLATRGVDQRDVFRISHNLLQEWLSTLPDATRHLAHEAARPMRSATRPHGELDSEYLVMREYVLRRDDPAARELAGLLRREKRTSLDVRPLKRRADLRRCWTTPSAGFRRYGLVDGSIPVVVVELGSNEVPVEDLFVVDGDEAVPALFRSRVFRIWAGATLPSASSWMARFSITSTFGGFPIVEPFRIVGQEGSLAALVADGAPRRLYTLADEIGRQIERQLARLHSRGWKAAHELGATGRAMDRLNKMILHWYGLSENASDITVLRRLQELNSTLR